LLVQTTPTFYHIALAPGLESVCPLIGKGTYGSVFKAVDPVTMNLVAVKTIKAGAYADREIDCLRRCLPCENIAHLHYTVPSCDLSLKHMVMEYADVDLFQIIKLRIPECIFKNIARQVLKGVAHMHACNVVHRDIKPANMVIDCVGRCKLVDFGLASVMSSTMVLQDRPDCVTTMNYRPPDILLGSTEPHT
jgi:CTD kinase subunit alpha